MVEMGGIEPAEVHVCIHSSANAAKMLFNNIAQRSSITSLLVVHKLIEWCYHSRTMPIYLAIPLQSDITPLKTAVQRNIQNEDSFELQAERGFLIKYPGTSVELCNKLEITGQETGYKSPVGPSLVAPFNTYYGRGPSEMWEWIQTRIEK
jgi:hypothetical protein